VIFSRRRGSSGRHAREDSRSGPRHAARRRTHDEFGTQPADDADREDAPEVPERGPYDAAAAPSDDITRLDLGSLRIPVVDGVEVRVQADPSGVIQQVFLVHGDSALQLSAYAAPRSESIWDEARAEIRTSLSNEGVTAEEAEGEYGPELRARIRAPEGLTDLRFVGVDGPRWLVRAVYQGPAAVDPAAVGPLANCLDGLVVDRGSEAMPVLEALPLRLPREMAEQAGAMITPTPAAPRATPDAPATPPANGTAVGGPRRKPSPRPRRSSR
jgi:hypothetical protein